MKNNPESPTHLGVEPKPYLIGWGNLSPKPPNKDAIQPRAKHGAFWHEVVIFTKHYLYHLEKEELYGIFPNLSRKDIRPPPPFPQPEQWTPCLGQKLLDDK